MVAAALTTSTGAWEVLAAPRREPRSVRLRRYAVILVGGVLVVTGGFTIAGQIRSWLVRPAPAAAAAQVVAESAFVGAAVPFAVDYLSWDDEDRPSRQAALARAVGPNTAVDGWAGSGRQWADSPAEVGFVRGDGDTAVVTVRVRIVPYLPASGGAGRGGRAATPGTDPRDAGDAGVNVASGPVPDAAGWAAQQPRWLNLAVPVARLGERIVVTATPALVGSPPQSAAGPAVASDEDTTFAQATQTTLGRLLGAYGTGDLDYARAASTSFTGLSKAATLQKVVEWRVREPDPSDGDGMRVGDATVTWALSGAAGSLTCPYRVELRDADGRWYLAAVAAETEEVN